MLEPKSHAERRNWLEELLRKVPGFRGYLEKSYRRESDALAREHLAGRLEAAKRALTEWTRRLADGGQTAALPECDRFRGRLDAAIGRIRGAMQGYSGMFDLVRVDEALLDRVYERDMLLVEQVDALVAAVEKAAGEPLAAQTLPELMTLVAQLDKSIAERSDMLKGLK